MQKKLHVSPSLASSRCNRKGKSDILVTLSSQNIVYVKNIVCVVIVIAIISSWFTRFRKNAAGIKREFVSKLRIDEVVSLRELGGESLQRLFALW